MRLPQPFIRLPIRFDAERLRAEAEALPPEAWAPHPNRFKGNSAARLITVGGQENDEVAGAMASTPHLAACPYIQQVLASFSVVWSRSRLMKLEGQSQVPEHSDINYHWFDRVRIHIPVTTRPEVTFHCGDSAVHMRAGEAWIFDNWRLHRVENPTEHTRIHLVADTMGSAGFWQLASSASKPSIAAREPRLIPYRPERPAQLMLERFNTFRVMPAAELERLVRDLFADATCDSPAFPAPVLALRLNELVEGLVADWRQVWALYGESDEGLPLYGNLVERTRKVINDVGDVVYARTNRLPIRRILEARVLQHAVNGSARADTVTNLGRRDRRPTAPQFDRPLIIVSAPRSGSTLLYETLSCHGGLVNLGGEAHWLVEGFPSLAPGAPGVSSNRIDETFASPELIDELRCRARSELRDSMGRALSEGVQSVRLIEKTPKNALRIPFFERAFPGALYVFLWRDPHENISSIIEAWKSGGWVTYRRLEGWDGPWSLLLPPGWEALRGRPFPEIAATQWATTNSTIMDDLEKIAPSRRIVVRYDQFLTDPAETVRRICTFADLAVDAALSARVTGTLPLSRYTQTPPEPDKWRRNEEDIRAAGAIFAPVWQRLARFG